MKKIFLFLISLILFSACSEQEQELIYPEDLNELNALYLHCSGEILNNSVYKGFLRPVSPEVSEVDAYIANRNLPDEILVEIEDIKLTNSKMCITGYGDYYFIRGSSDGRWNHRKYQYCDFTTVNDMSIYLIDPLGKYDKFDFPDVISQRSFRLDRETLELSISGVPDWRTYTTGGRTVKEQCKLTDKQTIEITKSRYQELINLIDKVKERLRKEDLEKRKI